TADHVKVTVFGPVVNLAARLESMTKHLGAPVLLGPSAAEVLRRSLPPELGRIRRVALVRPYGLASAVTVSELLPPAQQGREVNNENLRDYEAALDAFLAGRWSEALDLLRRLPSTDPVSRYLIEHINQNECAPPADWDGVIILESK